MSDDRLRLLVERVERIDEEIKGLRDDRRDVFAEARAVGFDLKTFRQVLARRRQAPADRAEADALLESYEAALGMTCSVRFDKPIMRPDVAELAHELLAAEIVALEDPEQAALLVDHVTTILDLRAEIAMLRGQEGERKKLAKLEGFDVNQLSVTIRWLEKCAKHGEEPMRAGEAVFHLYRGTVERHRASAEPVSADPTLRAMFTPQPPKPNKRVAAAVTAAAMARAAKQAREGE